MASWPNRYLESAGILSDSQYGFCKGLGTTNALLHGSHVLQNALDHGHEAKIVQIDFSAALSE